MSTFVGHVSDLHLTCVFRRPGRADTAFGAAAGTSEHVEFASGPLQRPVRTIPPNFAADECTWLQSNANLSPQRSRRYAVDTASGSNAHEGCSGLWHRATTPSRTIRGVRNFAFWGNCSGGDIRQVPMDCSSRSERGRRQMPRLCGAKDGVARRSNDIL